MELSIGVDIELVSRFSNNKYTSKKSLYKKIFTQKEIKYCIQKANPYPHFTGRFCAKEAAIKALNDKKIGLKDIEIIIKNKKPYLIINKKKIGKVSISHTKELAIAFVIIY